MLINRTFFVYVALMTLVVVASNILVQFPLPGSIAGMQLGDLLTWGAFSYPFAFLVTDLTNRQFGPRIARRVVVAGFIVAILLSIVAATPRIAIASGSAFLFGQLLDISVFNRLRRQSWWHAPLAGSLIGSALDTAMFFSFAFAPFFVFFGPNDSFALETAPLLGVLAAEAPRWISWAVGDLSVKILCGLVMLLPYGAPHLLALLQKHLSVFEWQPFVVFRPPGLFFKAEVLVDGIGLRIGGVDLQAELPLQLQGMRNQQAADAGTLVSRRDEQPADEIVEQADEPGRFAVPDGDPSLRVRQIDGLDQQALFTQPRLADKSVRRYRGLEPDGRQFFQIRSTIGADHHTHFFHGFSVQ
jgi:uncharacterized PurR-regulated membrane protein YhhQ (DUF165 family)